MSPKKHSKVHFCPRCFCRFKKSIMTSSCKAPSHPPVLNLSNLNLRSQPAQCFFSLPSSTKVDCQAGKRLSLTVCCWPGQCGAPPPGSGRRTRSAASTGPGSWPVTASRPGLWSPTRAPATPGSGSVIDDIDWSALAASSDVLPLVPPSLPPFKPELVLCPIISLTFD